MPIFENLTKRVTDTAKAAAKKSGDIVEVTKLNMSIGTEEDKIETVYTEIGKAVYDIYTKGEDVGEEFRDLCEKIRTHQKNIEEIKQKILELKNVKLCPSCSTELELDIAFCPKCGTKQEIPQPKAEEPKEKICPSCGVVNVPEFMFCGKCGTKLD